MLAPVVLFTYNRLEHLRQTIEALKGSELAVESELYIFSDGARTIQDKETISDVRHFLDSVTGFKNVRIKARKENMGLAESVITGVNEVLQQHDRVIVLEDDLVTSPDFLSYMNDCLSVFESRSDIFSISGYSPNISIPDTYKYDIYLSYRPNSWGWATWKDRWQKVDWAVSDFESFISKKHLRKNFERGGRDAAIMLLRQMTGRINSWAIRFYYACHKQNGVCIYPVVSRLRNIGTDGSGTNLGRTNKYNIPYELGQASSSLDPDIQINQEITQNFARFYKPSTIRRIINYIKIRSYFLRFPRSGNYSKTID